MKSEIKLHKHENKNHGMHTNTRDDAKKRETLISFVIEQLNSFVCLFVSHISLIILQ